MADSKPGEDVRRSGNRDVRVGWRRWGTSVVKVLVALLTRVLWYLFTRHDE